MSFCAHNAKTGEPIAPIFAEATEAEISGAADAAQQCADAYAAVFPSLRANFLEVISDELIARKAPLIERAHLETGLPIVRLEGELNRTTGQLRLFAALVREGSWVDARIDTALPDRKPLPRPDLRRMLRSIGPVAVFGASNFPFAFSVAGGDTASALAAGNPVIVKAHPAHPGTSGLAADAIRSAIAKTGIPAGVFALIHGSTPAVSLALVRHPAIAAVGFTGSTRAGRALFDAAAGRPQPIPVFSEMSSVNPLFVLPDALEKNGEAIAQGLVSSFTLGVGQFCTKPGLVFGIGGAAWDKFSESVAVKARDVPRGVMLHAGIQNAFTTGISSLNNVEWLAQAPAAVARVDASEFKTRPELAHEIFGPYVLLVTLHDHQEFTAMAAQLEGQLTATLHATSADLAEAANLIAVLTRKAGRLVCNGFPTGVEVSPAMHHGGPYPATTDVRFTSVGTAAILRFARPVCYQSFPDALLPPALQNTNPLGLLRLVNANYTRDALPL